MKISALRLREVGGFDQPVQLEGFSGELDVLVGPNELGKSTLLRALRAVFFEQHKSTSVKSAKALLHNLRPHNGGAPLIEVDFELDARRWRLRKQFLSARQAVLYDLDEGRVSARGDDADAAMRDLFEAHPGGKSLNDRLLWVGQHEALRVRAPDKDEQAGLRSLIEAQVGDVTDGGSARAIRQKMQARLDGLVTAKTQKPTEDYARALKNRDALRRDLEIAQAMADEAKERLARLGELAAARRAIDDPVAQAAREARLDETGKALASAQLARERLKAAQTNVEKCNLEQERATSKLSVYAAQLKELAELTALQTAGAQRSETLVKQTQQNDLAIKTAKAARGDLRRQLSAARAILARYALVERLQQAKDQLSAGQTQYARARKTDKEMRALNQELSALTVTAALVDQVRQLTYQLQSADAQLNAGAPQVTIAYGKDRAGKIRLNGTPLQDGVTLTPDAKLVLDIDAIGSITIEPGVSTDLEGLREDARAQREQLDVCLAQMDVKDLAAGEAALQARRKIEEQIGVHTAALAMLAPEGLERLAQDVQQWADKVAKQDEAINAGAEASTEAATDTDVDTRVVEKLLPEPPSPDNLPTLIARLDADWAVSADKFEQLSNAAAAQQSELAGLTAQLASQSQRLEAVLAMLPASHEERAQKRELLSAAQSSAERHTNRADLDLSDWRAKAGSEEAFALLQSLAREAQKASAHAATAKQQIKLDMVEAQSTLQALSQDGAPALVVELQEQLQRRDRQIERFAQDVAALQLLKQTLNNAESAVRDEFLGPVMANIQPYINLILPGASLQIDDHLDVLALQRDVGQQPLELLSAGTQEQIAVLVRLGFARLAAQAGAPIPLILDDALVYSDDERIARAFEALALAAKQHQVIILTCRAMSFAPLGGHRLKLDSWNPDDTSV